MRKLFLSLAFVMGLCAPSFAQVTPKPSGNELLRCTLPNGSACQIVMGTVRNSTNIAIKSGSGAATSTGAGGMLVWVGTAPTTWAITLPAAPADGTIQLVTTDTTLTSMVTVTAGSGDSIAAAYTSQTLTANTTVIGWQYYAAGKKWYRIQ